MFRRTFACTIAVVVALALSTRPRAYADQPSQPDDALNKQALALNDITGESAVEGEIRKLSKDPAKAKKLIAAATALANGKTQPFSYNAAHVLARVSQNVKDLESAQVFYRVCVDEANKLGSTQKAVTSYNALLGILFQQHKADEAGKVIHEILDLPDDDGRLRGLKMEMLQLVATNLAATGKTKEGLKIADDLIKLRPDDWRSYQTKLAVLRKSNDFDGAAKVAAHTLGLIKQNSDLKGEDKAQARRLVIAPFFQAGKKDIAARLAQDVVKEDPEDWRALEFEVAVLLEAGQADNARKEAEKALEAVDKDSSLDPEKKGTARRDLILAFAQSGKSEAALQLAERNAKLHPDDIDAEETTAALLEEVGHPEKAAAIYDRVLKQVADKSDADLQPERKAEIRRSAALMFVRAGQAQKALQLAESVIAATPDDWDAYESQAIALQELGRTDDAVKAYQHMLDLINKDPKVEDERRPRLLEVGRYMLSGVYVDANQLDKATEILQGLLRDHPDNPSYNNDLGYVWADHDVHLDEAEKMIRKAVDEDRKNQEKRGNSKPMANAAYLDSLGWVLFKKKNLPEAEKYLEEAIQDKKEGQHVEILDHLADVYMALGQKDKALSTWKQAIKVAGKTRRELDRKAIVEKKLKENEK
jgi:tetratricopeptide (TPR) repeat protein